MRVKTGSISPREFAAALAKVHNTNDRISLRLNYIHSLINGRPQERELRQKLEALFATPFIRDTTTVDHFTELMHMSVADAKAFARRHPDSVGLAAREHAARKAHLQPRRVKRACFPRPHVVMVDRRDPRDIFVAIKVRLVGAPKMVKQIQAMEDAIERRLRVPGFTVDVSFVRHTGEDVVEVGCDPKKWPTERNWVGPSEVLAHELMHLLGLEDEYDLTSHATNTAMPLELRLHWFAEQLERPMPPADWSEGIMNGTGGAPLPRHIAMAAGYKPATYNALLAGADAALSTKRPKKSAKGRKANAA